ncbi:MAG: hypothetical protein ABIL58_23170 [Pseudomonadota bacterium]
MDDERDQRIADLAADRALSRYLEKAPCGLSAEAAQEMPHLMGVLKDVGGGKHDNGIESLRAFLKTWGKVHRSVERAGGILLYLIIAAVAGGFFTLLKWGVERFLCSYGAGAPPPP